jgi:hypothetical protein
MPLRSPDLDDRTFDQLVREATARIRQVSPEWSDLSPGDPGMALVDVFAYLTEALIYRLNRVPDKLYIEFLRLSGITLEPPAAASARLVFRRDREGPIEIPRGTRVTLARPTPGAPAPVFATAETVSLPPGTDEVSVVGHDAEQVEAEYVGRASGQAGVTVTVRRPPIVARTGDPLDLIVGVESEAGELGEGDPAIEHDGTTYRVWREVANFTDLGPDDYVYMADRSSGAIVFAPEARTRLASGELSEAPTPLAAVPPPGRAIRVWYRRGGGAAGNVAAETLTSLKDPIGGVSVTNPAPATGGRDAESLENALIRGPQELHTLNRAVTARDFEFVAGRASGIKRARAITQAELWRYAQPGTVEVFLVPQPPEGTSADAITAEQLESAQTGEALERVWRALDERRPLGTSCLVEWTRYKTVRVGAEIVVQREEDREAVRRRVDERLHRTINPLPTDVNAGGWQFGQSLFASSVYKIILSEPGVRYARGIRLLVDEVPDTEVRALAADPFQPRTWYAASATRLFRSLNDGDGWEAMARFESEAVTKVEPHPDRPGLLAMATSLGERRSRVHISRDSGGTWQAGDPLGFGVKDLAWLDRGEDPILLLATDVGLYSLDTAPGADPDPILVDPNDQDLGFDGVAALVEPGGEQTVAVAAQELKGVYLSNDGAADETFSNIGLEGKTIRVLEVRRDGPNRYLWAGIASPGGEEAGEGALSWQLLGRDRPIEKWRAWRNGWKGGSCFALAFQGRNVLAASYSSGVLVLDTTADEQAAWKAPGVDSNLIQKEVGKFEAVNALAADPEGRLVIAGADRGLRRSRDGGATYDDCSRRVFGEEVTIPPTWLFCDGANEIEVRSGA